MYSSCPLEEMQNQEDKNNARKEESQLLVFFIK